MKTLAALALILAFATPAIAGTIVPLKISRTQQYTGESAAKSEESGTFTATDLLINRKDTAVNYLLVLQKDSKEVLSVTPDGVVRLNGVELDKLSTEEARVAWLAVAKYMLKLNNDTGCENRAWVMQYELDECRSKAIRNDGGEALSALRGSLYESAKLRADICERREKERSAADEKWSRVRRYTGDLTCKVVGNYYKGWTCVQRTDGVVFLRDYEWRKK